MSPAAAARPRAAAARPDRPEKLRKVSALAGFGGAAGFALEPALLGPANRRRTRMDAPVAARMTLVDATPSRACHRAVTGPRRAGRWRRPAVRDRQIPADDPVRPRCSA